MYYGIIELPLGYEKLLFRMVDLDSSEGLLLLISVIVKVNLLLGSDLGTIGCGVICHYLSWDQNCDGGLFALC